MAAQVQVKTEPTEEIDFEFLPLIYEIIRSIEKENHDAAQKAKDFQNTTLKMNELRNKLQQYRESIQRLPGIDYSKDDQVKRFEALRKQLIMKRELLIKYRNYCHFEVVPK